MNYLFLGDCYDILRNDIPDESVDLIYIDLPEPEPLCYYCKYMDTVQKFIG